MNAINEIFLGQLINKTTCTMCNNADSNIETTYDITLPIVFDNNIVTYNSFLRQQNSASFYRRIVSMVFPSVKGVVDLKECLDKYFSIEELDVNNLSNYRQCGECDQKTPFARKTSIKAPPKHLLIILKRYGDSMKYKVAIPFDLDITEYCVEPKEKIFEYSLYSIVTHVGLNNLGHYKCYCRNHMNNL